VCVSVALGPNNVIGIISTKRRAKLGALESVCLSAGRWDVRNVQVYYNGIRMKGEAERERCHLYIILSLRRGRTKTFLPYLPLFQVPGKELEVKRTGASGYCFGFHSLSFYYYFLYTRIHISIIFSYLYVRYNGNISIHLLATLRDVHHGSIRQNSEGIKQYPSSKCDETDPPHNTINNSSMIFNYLAADDIVGIQALFQSG
jgi:hypothetical protein